VVPFATDKVPVEGPLMYPDVTFIPRGVGVRALTPEGYDAAWEGILPAAKELAKLDIDAIMVIGTSLTFYRGAAFNRTLTESLSAATGLPASTMSGALVDGLEEVGARRVAVVTAYSADVNAMLAAFLRECGFDVLALRSVSVAKHVGEAAKMAESDILHASVGAFEQAGNADGVLIVCGGLRTLDVAPLVEARCHVPVVSSMPAALRKAAQLAGASAMLPAGYGRLLSGAPAISIGEVRS